MIEPTYSNIIDMSQIHNTVAEIECEEFLLVLSTCITTLTDIRDVLRVRYQTSVTQAISSIERDMEHDDFIEAQVEEHHRHWWKNNSYPINVPPKAKWWQVILQKEPPILATETAISTSDLKRHVERERERLTELFHDHNFNFYFGAGVNNAIAEILLGERIDRDAGNKLATANGIIANLNEQLEELSSARYDTIYVPVTAMRQLATAKSFIQENKNEIQA